MRISDGGGCGDDDDDDGDDNDWQMCRSPQCRSPSVFLGARRGPREGAVLVLLPD